MGADRLRWRGVVRFTRKKLNDAGIPDTAIEDYLSAVNLLPNLQLLAGTANIQKQDDLPADWMESAFPSDEKRATYLADNDVDGLPLDLMDFLTFFEQRKLRIRDRLIKTLVPQSAQN